MDKAELVDMIRELNSTATEEFLEQFTEQELKQYLDHLKLLNIHDLTAATCSST